VCVWVGGVGVRGFFTGLSAGVGGGLAWTDCGAAFKNAGLTKFPTLPPREVAKVEEPPKPKEEKSH
jgi:hypothetical protein